MFTAAIIGRPNVGKSTLFNRLTGRKMALVDDIPGLTRDRKEGTASIGEIDFNIIDTAGLEDPEKETIEELMMLQTEIAMDEADVLFMMVDGKTGVTAMDLHFAEMVRKKNKPSILIVNKCESRKTIADYNELYSLGLGEPVAISAEHGEGMADLYDALDKIEISSEHSEKEKNDFLQIALTGRPNVGKSTLFNSILGENRSIASPVSGTTRDSIYVERKFHGNHIRLVDTAGMRKKAKRNETLEQMSVRESYKAIQYANIVVLLINGVPEKMDLLIAEHVLKEGRGLVIAVNKWDLVNDRKEILDEIQYKLERSLPQAKGVPVITISALKEKGVDKVLKTAMKVFHVWNKRVGTGKLNRWLEEALITHTPPLCKGRRIKFKYITQAKTRPPTFSLFTSANISHLPDSYTKYLINSLRREFEFDGVPIRLLMRKTKNPFVD